MANPTLFEQIKKIFDRYGVPADVWYPIAMAESGFNPNAKVENDRERSYGLFQLNILGGQGKGHNKDQLLDPVTNASIAAPSIARAFAQVKNLPREQWAAATAQRSGHPGGSIENASDITKSFWDKISNLQSQFLKGEMALVPQPITSAATDLGKTLGDKANSISGQTKGLLDLISDPKGALLVSLGIVLVIIAMTLLAMETDAGKAATSAAVTGAKVAAKAAAA